LPPSENSIAADDDDDGDGKLKEKAIPGKHSIDLLKQTAILERSHIIQKVLQCET
jgi:hypothetical protein